jgi:hypothetical protein
MNGTNIPEKALELAQEVELLGGEFPFCEECDSCPDCGHTDVCPNKGQS